METLDNEHLLLIVIDGPMGAGKTTTSKLLNEKIPGTARIALSDVKRFISDFEASHTYNKISQEIILIMAEEYLKRGVSVIVEWAMKAERTESLTAIASKYDASSFIFQLDAPKELLLQRVLDRTKNLLSLDELPAENIQNIRENFEKNYSFHLENKHQSGVIICSASSAPKEIVEQMLQQIGI